MKLVTCIVRRKMDNRAKGFLKQYNIKEVMNLLRLFFFVFFAINAINAKNANV